MLYLLTEIWIALIAAFAGGAFCGWSLSAWRSGLDKSLDNQAYEARIARVEQERDTLRAEAAELRHRTQSNAEPLETAQMHALVASDLYEAAEMMPLSSGSLRNSGGAITLSVLLDEDADAIALLREQDITSVDDLLMRTQSEEALLELAESCQARVEDIRRWRSAAELAALAPLSVVQIQLLIDCGIVSIEDLGGRFSESLCKQLKEVNDHSQHLLHAPELSEVQVWIDSAQEYIAVQN